MPDRAVLEATLRALDHGDLARVRELLEHALAAESLPSVWSVGAVMHDRWEIFGDARGGMGHVYFVVDREWDARLAVKTLTLPEGLAADRAASLVRMFRRETQLWLDLGAHPNIVSAFYTLELDGALRLFMEYVPGQTLAGLLERGRLALVRILDLALQLVGGMEFVHARGVVHRDLKPANCLVMDDDTLRITDFGLGKQERELPATEVSGLDATGAVLPEGSLSMFAAGTPLYMSPEQWFALGDASKASDVYAFGVILYEMLAGSPPFAGAGIRALHERAVPQAPSAVGAESTADLDALVLACLAKRTGDRPTFATLRSTLLAIYEAVAGATYPRTIPDGLEPDEGGENNRAASYYAMGDVGRAQDILDAWLAVHPLALYPWINRQVIALDTGAADAAHVAGDLRERIVSTHATPERQLATLERRLAWSMLVHPDVVGPISAGRGLTATACSDRFVRVFRETALERTFATDTSIVALAGLEHGRLVAALLDGRIVEWIAGEDRPRVLGKLSAASALAVLATGEVLALGSEMIVIEGNGSTRTLYSPSRMRSIAVHPDGTRIAIGGDDCRVTLWKLDGTRTATKIQHTSPIVACAWLPSGRGLIVGDTEDAVVWTFTGDQAEGGDTQHRGKDLRGVAISPDGRVAACSDGPVIALWDPSTGEPIRRLVGHRETVHAVCFDERGRLLSSSSDGTVRRWDVPRPAPIIPAIPLLIRRRAATRARIEHRSIRKLIVERLAAGDTTAIAELDRLCEQAPEHRRDPEIVRALAPLHARATSRTLRDAWCAWQIPFSELRVVGAHRDGLVIVDGAGVAMRLSIDGKLLASTTKQPETRRTALAPNGEIAISCNDAEAWLWSTSDGAERIRLRGHSGWIDGVSVSADGSSALTASDDRTARVWDLATGTPIGAPLEHPERVWSCASTNGRRIVTGCRDGIVRVWASNRLLEGIRREGECFGARGEIAPSGEIVAATIRVNRGAVTTLARVTGEHVAPFAELPLHTDAPALAVFSPDGRLLVTGGRGDPVRVWDVATGSLVRQLGTTGDATAAAFVAHGSAIAVAHAGTLALWRLDLALTFA